jgi:O-antigen/teichoic acid export membrane protein
MKRILKDGVIYGAADALQKLLYFLIIPILTSILSPDEYGSLGLALQLVVVLKLLASFSLDSSITRYYYTFPSQLERDYFVGSTILHTLLVTAAVTTVLISILSAVNWAVPVDNFLLWALVVLTPQFSCIYQATLGLMRIQGRALTYTTLSLSYSLILYPTILGGIYFTASPKPATYIGALIFVSALYSALSLVVLKREQLKFEANREWLRMGMQYSLPILGIQLVNSLNSLVDKFAIKQLVGENDLGLYVLSYQFSTAVLLVATSLNSAYIPRFFSLANDVDKGPRLILMDQYKLGVIVSGVGLVALIIVPAIASRFLSDAYSGYLASFYPLVLVAMLMPTYFYFTNVLAMHDLANRMKARTAAGGLVVNIALTIPMTLGMGSKGAGIAMLISTVLIVAGFYYLIVIYLPQHTHAFKAAIPFVLSAMLAVALLSLPGWMNGMEVAIAKLLSVGALTSILIKTKLFVN